MKAIISTVLKSPILHFLVLGLAAFFLYERLKPPPREAIRITTQTTYALIQQRESIAQNPVAPEERESWWCTGKCG
jgi:hypothetical protein